MRRRGFTLIEVMIAVSIFAAVMGLVLISVVGLFRSMHQSQKILSREQRVRFVGLRLSKEIACLIHCEEEKISFQGRSNEFFIVFAKEDTLAESKYAYNSSKFTLEHYAQEPADYDADTYGTHETVLEGLGNCKFSYYDGAAWIDSWDKTGLPRAIKITLKFNDETKERELSVNVPVSQ